MASRVRKRLSAAERRVEILSAALRAFARDGYDNAKMDGIAEGARVTKPVLYDHFPSKQALFLAVLESIRDRLLGEGRSIAAGDGEPEQKFRRAVDAFMRFVEREPDAARVLLTVPGGDAAAAAAWREVQAGASAGIAGLLVAFMPGSSPWQLHAAGEFLKEGMHAIAGWWLANPGPARGEIVDLVTRIAWLGLRTPPALPGRQP